MKVINRVEHIAEAGENVIGKIVKTASEADDIAKSTLTREATNLTGEGIESGIKKLASEEAQGATRLLKEGAGEENGVLGGAYKDITRTGGEIHHMPTDSVSPLSRGDGPAINMETVDHRQTASWGSSKEAQMYRTQQKNLIDQGDFKGAQQKDIDDVITKFGDKYNQAIEQMKNYTNIFLK